MATSDDALPAAELLGLLAEPARLRVVAALALGSQSLAEISAATGLDARSAGRALTRLVGGGLVDEEDAGWSLREDVIAASARAAAPERPVEDHGAGNPEDAAVLRAFLRNGRLRSIPAARGKRLVVLDHIVRVFEPGVRYPEREVDAALRAFHPDHAALRRYLVDEGLLSRERGVYWRSGGTFDIGAD